MRGQHTPMILDAHLHVWHPQPEYPDPGVTIIGPHSDVPIELLHQYMAEHEVDRAVLVQPLFPGEDNSYVAACAAAEPERFAAVCYVDPRVAGAEERLAYWAQERGCKGLRFRPRVPAEAASFGAATTYPIWERAAALKLVVSVYAAPEHLAAVSTIARHFPDLAIVLDHLALPDVSDSVSSLARVELLELARFPMVYVKLSGYYYFSRQAYPFADCYDLIRRLHEEFGSSRLIWGSDFPHVVLKTGYRRSLMFLERTCPFLGAADLDRIMGRNAAALYWP